MENKYRDVSAFSKITRKDIYVKNYDIVVLWVEPVDNSSPCLNYNINCIANSEEVAYSPEFDVFLTQELFSMGIQYVGLDAVFTIADLLLSAGEQTGTYLFDTLSVDDIMFSWIGDITCRYTYVRETGTNN